MKLNLSNKNRKRFTKHKPKKTQRQKKPKKTKKTTKTKKQNGGTWAPWEGVGSVNNYLSNIIYNRFVRAPYLSEM